MIKYKKEFKTSANEFSKLFIMDFVETLNSDIDDVIAKFPETFQDFTDKELEDFKTQFPKKVESIRNIFSIEKLRKKIGQE